MRRIILLLSLFLTFLVLGCASQMSNSPTLPDTYSGMSITQPPPPVIADSVSQELKRAEFYYGLGVSANQSGEWIEAQKNFEKALEILSELPLDEETNLKFVAEANKLLHEISNDYKTTLISLGGLSSETSVNAFLEKFRNIENFKKPEGEKEIPPPALASEEQIPLYDIPMEWNERVQNAIIYFQTVARKPFESYLARSGKYGDLMRGILKERGLPQDLLYLCLIESGFNPKAYSYAKAVGPWQFIASTGRLYGLKRNAWYDERRDFVKSTYAACDYLKFLYEKFGDWHLAMAAYNAGEGSISRAMEKYNTDNFWDLNLRKQTEDYVPLFMAATIIAKDPIKYGFDVQLEEPIQFETVVVDNPVDLRVVAKTIGCDLQTLRELNPELSKDVTPPRYSNYILRVPPATADLFTSNYENIPKKKNLASDELIKHKIKKGETLSSIAQKYNVTASDIASANNMGRGNNIIAGNYLLVPQMSWKEEKPKKKDNSTPTVTTKSENQTTELPAGIIKETDSALNLSGLKKSDNPKPENKNNSITTLAGKLIVHVIKRGETLWKIGQLYGVSMSKILTWNNIDNPHRVKVGEKIKIYF
jgi:membrane-bound lytic murein transglycosylase D